MIGTLISSLVVFSAQTPFVASMPPGTSAELAELVRAISVATHEGRWQDASAIAAKLPQNKLKIAWDDAVFQGRDKDVLEISREEGTNEVAKRIYGFAPTYGATGSVVIRYVRSNAMKTTFSTTPGTPWVVFEFPAERSNPARSVIGTDASNDVQFALLRASGVATNTDPRTIMGRSDASPLAHLAYVYAETSIAKSAVEFSEKVRAAVAAHAVVNAQSSHMELGQTQVDLGTAMQGDAVDFQFSIKNTGDAPLHAYVKPDCGCVITDKEVTIPAGQTKSLNGSIETADYTGTVEKAISIISNDNSAPFGRVGLKVIVAQRYRMIYPANRLLYVDGPKIQGDLYVVFGTGIVTSIQDCIVQGATGKATAERWRGNVVDPETNTALKDVFGYKIHFEIEPPAVPGRVPFSVILKTNDEKYLNLTATMNIQRGIVAMPEQVYFGDLSNIKRELIVLLSQRGRPFKITGVKSSSKFVTAAVEATKRPDEFRLVVKYDGRAPIGALNGFVAVSTTDAKQPTLKIGFRGTVQ